MAKTSDLVFGCSVVRSYHPYIFRECSVTTFKLFIIQSQFLSIDVVLVVIVLRRLIVITEEEKARVLEECHSAPFSGHAGRNNTLWKLKERFYWPGYYKDTMEMASYKFHLFANAPS